MTGGELGELATFLAVAHHRSFRRAAIERGVAASAISHSIRSLEARVGVRVFHRTTRSVSLTEAGERFLAELGPAFGQIGKAVDGLNAYRETPFGTVRINVPNSVAPFVLRDVMGPLLRDNPGLSLDIVATDRLMDIAEDGFDAGIRFREQLPQEMVAVKLRLRPRFAVVGSPAYFADRPLPVEPADLHAHSCIRYRFPSGAFLDWGFERAGETVEVSIRGVLTLDDQELMVEAALQGCGLAYIWDDRVMQHIHSGRLIRCLDEWCAYDDGLFLYYPSRRHLSAGLRAMIDLLRE